MEFDPALSRATCFFSRSKVEPSLAQEQTQTLHDQRMNRHPSDVRPRSSKRDLPWAIETRKIPGK